MLPSIAATRQFVTNKSGRYSLSTITRRPFRTSTAAKRAAIMAGDKPTPLKRSVAGSFIFKYPEDGEGPPKVALFRRSDKVRTYQGAWAPVSGSIEPTDPSPLATAWRELKEETTLTASSLELMRHGKSYSFGDASVGREWTIYPFAFRLRTAAEGGRGEAGVKIDWEHRGWDWHDPLTVEDSDAFGGVPRLAESLRRVYFEKDLGEAAGGVLAKGLHTLKTDYQSGARQLATVALRVLRHVVGELDAGDKELWWKHVRFAAWHLWKNGRESMGAAILSMLAAELKSLEKVLETRGDSAWRDAVLDKLDERVASRGRDSAQRISQSFSSYISNTFGARGDQGTPISILTLSESSTITYCLRHAISAAGCPLELRVLESRPLFEGVSLAAAFVDDAKKVAVYPDSAAAIAAEGVDLVVVGADRISSSGAVSNKAGSLPTILSAKHVAPKAPVVVVGEIEKVAPPGNPTEHVVEEGGAEAVLRAWNSGDNSTRIREAGRVVEKALGEDSTVAVRNVFFEWVPPDLVDVYITEDGPLDRADIAKHSERLGGEAERLFAGV